MDQPRERSRLLLRQMTLKEKVAQLCAAWLNIEHDGSFRVKSLVEQSGQSNSLSVLQDGIGEITRPFGTKPLAPAEGVHGVNKVQAYLVKQTRLGIPALFHEECLAGVMSQGATQFPSGISMGATWDEDTIEAAAAVIGKELYAVGARQGLSPVLDVSRDVRWGRTEESMGEDPYLVGMLASAYVSGLQGHDRRILATLKHYVGHSFSEGGRNHAPVRIGDRELYDIFCLPFEMAVKRSKAGSVMPAYHDIDGEPCHASRHLLTDMLRSCWGFDGLVVSDYEGLSQLHVDHQVARDMAEAAARSLKAGVDIELPSDTCYRRGLLEALDRGLITMDDIDEAVMRVLAEKYRLGLFDQPYIDPQQVVLHTDDHRQTAFETAQKSVVLMENRRGLPLKDKGRIACIGPLADEPYAMFCGYSFPTHIIGPYSEEQTVPRHAKTVVQALRETAQHAQITYAKGCSILAKRSEQAVVFPGEVSAKQEKRESYISYDESGIQQAVEAAAQADAVVLAVGDLAGLFRNGTVGEGSDVTDFQLPGVQQKLIDAVLDTGVPVVILLITGRPYDIGRGWSEAAAVVEAWLPGETGGEVLAGILFGKYSPGGKLPVSFPKHAGAMPYFYNHHKKSPGLPAHPDFGYKYPFGYGLSYTSFSYISSTLETETVSTKGSCTVRCVITNSGSVPGDEVVQLYIRNLYAERVRPVRELKGFKRVHLDPGQTAELAFEIPADMLGYAQSAMERVVEPGSYMLMIGSSSEDIAFIHTLELTGQRRVLPAKWRMASSATVHYVP